jgi:hypothetical protein
MGSVYCAVPPGPLNTTDCVTFFFKKLPIVKLKEMFQANVGLVKRVDTGIEKLDIMK